MELYRTYPKLCTIWCCIEVALYAGQIFGWSAILFILKQEGFYISLCEDITKAFTDSAVDIAQIRNATERIGVIDYYLLNISDKWLVAREGGNNSEPTNHSTYFKDVQTPIVDGQMSEVTGCKEQEARLNLWFSAAVCVSYVTCSTMGYLLKACGMRKFRLCIIFCYIVGALMIGLATPDTGWLICPGLCFIGVSGMALYSSNVQMSFLFPTLQSTITAMFVGLYDVSTIIPFITKVAFEAGVSRRYSCIGLSVLLLLLLGPSTLFMLPHTRIKSNRISRKSDIKSRDVEVESKVEKETFILHVRDNLPLRRTLLSSEYILHVYWMGVQALRFVSFLGFFNAWMMRKFHGNNLKENYYLGIFSYVTMATIVTAVTAGMLHDCQRRKYMLTGEFRRKRLPIILPLTVTSLMAIVITSLTFVEMEAFLNVVFILFTIYRSYLFSYEITFLNDVYPLSSFPVLFGLLHSSAGLSGMLQYPLFEWYKAYSTAHHHVNILLICLSASSLVHPLHIWFTCRKHRGDHPLTGLSTEFYI